jgi:lysophospholipase L1-like esterase
VEHGWLEQHAKKQAYKEAHVGREGFEDTKNAGESSPIPGFGRQNKRFLRLFCKKVHFMQKSYLCGLLALLIFAACKHQPLEMPDPAQNLPEKIDILALGDSYTKGEGVPGAQNFPAQLFDSLRAGGKDMQGFRVIAQTGWRTDQLKNAIAGAADIQDSVFSLVTLCIGVNNQFQNASLDTYKTEFAELLQTAVARAGGRKSRVLVLSIPDWAYTPFGQSYFTGPSAISEKIDIFNAANKAITEAQGIAYVDVTTVSRQGVAQPDLVALDRLHPAAKQYTEWVKLMLPVVERALKF